MSTFSQLFPPKPEFTEEQLKDLSGRVYIITGATSGVGFELAKILYSRNGTVFVGGRSAESTSKAIREIRKSFGSATGQAKPFIMDLACLKSVQAGANRFLAEERRLDVLFHNAGVMTPPPDSKSGDGYDLELATNCLAPFLLTTILKPALAATAEASGGSRVVFVSSMVNVGTPQGGVIFDKQTGNPAQMKGMDNYMQSKAGELFLAKEFSREWADLNIASVVRTVPLSPALPLLITSVELPSGPHEDESPAQQPATSEGYHVSAF